jgi:uncharacterized damage-inducible protein DinB
MKMTLTELFVAQLEREGALTRKALQRVPEGQNGFKPHERSMELGYLAALVAGMPGWIAFMIERDELDLDRPDSEGFRTRPVSTRAELLASLDAGLDQSRQALWATTDEHLMTPWAFRIGGRTVQQQARHLMIADAVFGHLAHHRGQLTVYLRLAASTVPALYGPSADEMF